MLRLKKQKKNKQQVTSLILAYSIEVSKLYIWNQIKRGKLNQNYRKYLIRSLVV